MTDHNSEIIARRKNINWVPGNIALVLLVRNQQAVDLIVIKDMFQF